MNPYTAGQFEAYRQTQVQTASPVELVVMLYRGALRFTKAGIDGVNRRDVEAAHKGFVRAQDILVELSTTLNFERGGEIATRLQAIYTFLNDLLMQANMKKAVEPAEHAVQLLQELLSAWEHLNQSQKAGAPGTTRAA